jgi:hypothetical protein
MTSSATSSLQLVLARFESSWRILVSYGSATTKISSVAVVNSTVDHNQALAFQSLSGGDPDSGCGPLSLICLLESARLVASGLIGDQLGLTGSAPDSRSSFLRSRVAVNQSWLNGTLGDRFQVTSQLLAGSLLVLRDASVASLNAAIIARARAEFGAVVTTNETARFQCKQCTFNQTAAEVAGGVVSVSGSSSAEFSQGTVFDQGRAMYAGSAWIQDTGRLTIMNSSITNGNASGFAGGIALVLSGSAEVKAVVASRNRAGSEAGFLFVGDSSVLQISDGTILSDNAATSGGAVSVAGDAVVTITDSYCKSNQATRHGGCLKSFGNASVTVSGGLLSSNSATLGGAVASSGGMLDFRGVTCDSNLASNTLTDDLPSSFGGCIYGTSSAKVLLADSLFLNNSALDRSSAENTNGSGGAVFLTSSSILISRSSFVGNWGDLFAGALGITNSTSTISDSLFYQNSASYQASPLQAGPGADQQYASGGAIAASAASSIVLTNVSLVVNSADWQGGSIYSMESSVIINGSTIANSSAVFGGAFCGQGSATVASSVSVSNLRCLGNQARFGGCLFLKFLASATLSEAEISGNVASFVVKAGTVQIIDPTLLGSNGGGIVMSFVFFGSITDVRFTGNRGDVFGGALYLESFIPSSLSIAGILAKGNAASAGGFLLALGSVRVQITGLDCQGNRAESFLISGFAMGGCVCSMSVSSLIIQDSRLIQNVASNLVSIYAFGGALADSGSASILLQNMMITENAATYVSGGLFFMRDNASGNVTVRSSSFSKNMAFFPYGLDVGLLPAMSLSQPRMTMTLQFFDCIFSFTFGGSLSVFNGRLVALSFKRCQWTVVGSVMNIAAEANTTITVSNSVVSGINRDLFFFKLGAEDLFSLKSTAFGSPVQLTVIATNFSDLNSCISAYNETVVHIYSSNFDPVKTLSEETFFQLFGNARLTVAGSSFSRISAKAFVTVQSPCFVALSNLVFSDSIVFERATLWIHHPSAVVTVSNVSFTGATARCAILACMDSATLLTLTNITVRRSTCLLGDPILSSYAVRCAVVSASVFRSTLLLRNFDVQEFSSWVLFAQVSSKGLVDVDSVTAAGFTDGGVLRVGSFDGFGRFVAKNVRLRNSTFSEGGSTVRLEHAPPRSRQTPKEIEFGDGIRFPPPRVFSVSLEGIDVESLRVHGGAGAILYFAPTEFVTTQGLRFSNENFYNVSVRAVRAVNVSVDRGGALLMCTGKAWAVSIQDAVLQNFSSKEPDAHGGTILLRDSCSANLRSISSFYSFASSGGFASISSRASLSVADVHVESSIAMGSSSLEAAMEFMRFAKGLASIQRRSANDTRCDSILSALELFSR